MWPLCFPSTFILPFNGLSLLALKSASFIGTDPIINHCWKLLGRSKRHWQNLLQSTKGDLTTGKPCFKKSMCLHHLIDPILPKTTSSIFKTTTTTTTTTTKKPCSWQDPSKGMGSFKGDSMKWAETALLISFVSVIYSIKDDGLTPSACHTKCYLWQPLAPFALPSLAN